MYNNKYQDIYLFIIIIIVFIVSIGFSSAAPVEEGEVTSETEEPIPQNWVEFFKNVHKTRREVDQKSLVSFTLTNNTNGEEKKIELIRILKNYGGKDGFDTKSIFFTKFPLDVKGINVLLWSYSQYRKSDDVWVYLPALKKTMRVPSKEEYSPFLGSDLTYADITPRRVDQDLISFLKVEVLDGQLCYVLEKLPLEPESIYSKKIEWISRKKLLPIRIDYYDLEKRFLKYQKIKWLQIKERWTWQEVFVEDVQSKHTTLFEVKRIDTDFKIDDSLFTQRALTYGIDEEGNIAIN